MGDQPISTWTSAAYLLAGAALLLLDQSPETLTVFGGFALLTVFTGLFHADWSPVTADLDHAGMIGLLVALATGACGGPAWLMIAGGGAAATLLVFWRDVYSHPLIALILYFVLVGLIGRESWVALGAGLGALAAGFAAWTEDTDWAHGAWHILTALGLATLWLAVL